MSVFVVWWYRLRGANAAAQLGLELLDLPGQPLQLILLLVVAVVGAKQFVRVSAGTRSTQDAELLGLLDIGPAQRRGLRRAARPSVEQQPDDGIVDERRPGGRSLRTRARAAAPAPIAGGGHQVARLVVGEVARLAGLAAPLLPRVLAGDATERVGDERRLRLGDVVTSSE